MDALVKFKAMNCMAPTGNSLQFQDGRTRTQSCQKKKIEFQVGRG